MLSSAAFNAFLKTLEEPPKHAIFILATTEKHKIIPTILSRCQIFDFKRITVTDAKEHLAEVAKSEGIEAEDDALHIIAQKADGAMRDAESLLERLLASGEPITRLRTEDALGLPPQDQMRKLAEYLAKSDLSALLTLSTDLYYSGFAPSSLAEHLTSTFRDALAAKVLGDEDFSIGLSEKDFLRVIHALDDELDRFSRRDNLLSLEVALIKALNALTHNVPSDAVMPAQEGHAEPSVTSAASSNLPEFDPNARAAANPSSKQSQAREPLMKANTDGSPSPVSWHKIKKAADPKLKAFLNPAQEEISGKTIKTHRAENFD